MTSIEEIKKYLPQYLSDSATVSLFEELKQFPSNIDQRIYTERLKGKSVIFQGDGLIGLLYVNLPDTTAKPLLGMIFSNTCDIDPQNNRLFDARISFAPVFNLNKYKNALIEKYVNSKKKTIQAINSHIDDIKKQNISQIFYLPQGSGLEQDSIVFLDRINNLPSGYFSKDQILKNRLFTLSDYGFYLFLFKLSVHFTRVRESIQRSE